MAESLSSLGYPDIAASVGRFLGYGELSSEWTSTQLFDINEAIDSGMRDVLRKHTWHFTKLTATLTTVSGTDLYTMPDNFQSMRGPFVWPDTVYHAPIQVTDETRILDLKSGSDQSGFPELAAIRFAAQDGTAGHRQEVIFYPKPNAVWILSYSYNLLVNHVLRAGTPYPPGGMMFAELYKMAALAKAELFRDDEKGIYNSEYFEALADSVERDKDLAPGNMGYNGDNSDNLFGRNLRDNTFVSINGAIPT